MKIIATDIEEFKKLEETINKFEYDKKFIETVRNEMGITVVKFVETHNESSIVIPRDIEITHIYFTPKENLLKVRLAGNILFEFVNSMKINIFHNT